MAKESLDYKEIIKNLVETGADELITNKNTNHAKVLIRYLFKTSKKRICIFSSQLNEEIYDDKDVISEIEGFVSRNGRVEILLQQPEVFNRDRRIFEVINRFSDRFFIKSVVDLDDKVINAHFVVNDNGGFRFCSDKKNPSAIASFNQTDTAKNLIEQFDILFERAALFER